VRYSGFVLTNPWQPVFDVEWAVGVLVIAIDYWLVTVICRRRGEPVSGWRVAAFAGGLGVIAGSLFSPIEHLALTSMLSFHLLQNVMLGDWAPPLLILGLSKPMVDAIASRDWLVWIASPRVALGVWLVTWYVTHIPAVYDYSLRHAAALGIEHLAFLVSGLAFWWPEIAPGYLSPVGKVVYLGVAFLAVSPLALAIYLAPHPLYSFYLHTPTLGGIRALVDQQIGGAAMAAEGDVVLIGVMVFNLFRALAAPTHPPGDVA
jgi:putative membrane protein